jgi:hypothetical protein
MATRVHFYFSAEAEDGDEFYLRKYKFNKPQIKLQNQDTNKAESKINVSNWDSSSKMNKINEWLNKLFYSLRYN